MEWLDGHPPGHIPPVLRAERPRIRARLMTSQGDSTAGAAFHTATQAFRDVGSPYHLAVGVLDQADHVRAGKGPLATRLLAAEAGEITRKLGARPLLERAERFAADADRQPRPAVVAGSGA